jgi:hypothetical protein
VLGALRPGPTGYGVLVSLYGARHTRLYWRRRGARSLAGVDFAAFGLHAVVWGAILSCLRQEFTTPRLRERAESAHRFAESGAARARRLVAGQIAANFGRPRRFG